MIATQAEEIKARGNRMIEREIERCKAEIGLAAWAECGDWITDHIVAGAREWIEEQAAKGTL